MYKLKNLIGHISSSKKAESRARTKVSRIPLNFFSFIMLILTEMFCATIFIAIYWSLCAYCEIISLLKRGKKRTKEAWKFMFDVGPLCCAAYYIARLRRLFYGSKYFHGILRRKRRRNAAGDWRISLDFGPVMSDKNKRTFYFSLPTLPRLVCLCFCSSDVLPVIV